MKHTEAHKNRVKGQVYVFENPKLYNDERFVKLSGESHKPYQYRSKLLKKLCKDAGVRQFGYHALRHYGASLLADKGHPITVIQEILGHEDRRTTEIYIQAIQESVKEALEHLCVEEVIVVEEEENKEIETHQ